MKKISKLLLGILLVGSMAGCDKEPSRKGSVVEAFKGLEDITSATVDIDYNVDMKDFSMSMGIKMAFDEDEEMYVKMEMFGEETESYTAVVNGKTCEINYYDEDEMDTAGWYGECEEETADEENDYDLSAFESYTDEDFNYKDGWYILSDEKTQEIRESMSQSADDDFSFSIVDYTEVEDLKIKVRLANKELDQIKMTFSVTDSGMKVNYEFIAKLSKINGTKVNVPTFTEIE
ncbi:MAG: hypothetical protein E7184_00765 [Erysipelotrichaceae bacterium]|nr:hypothetical protein [Erysipelotrichaceae bacterium]